MKSKYFAIGALMGIFLGLILPFLFPEILNFFLKFDIYLIKHSGSNIYDFSPKSGSLFNVAPYPIAIFGLIGGLIGFIIDKKRNRKN